MNEHITAKNAQPRHEEFVEQATREMIDAFSPEQQRLILQAIERNIDYHYAHHIEELDKSLKIAKEQRHKFITDPTAMVMEELKKSDFSMEDEDKGRFLKTPLASQ